MRRLIVNADDLGMTAGVNRGIALAHEQGIVSSTTLMATGSQFDGAVKLVSSLSLSVGCHVVLADGVPVSEPRAVPTLLKEHDPLQRFRLNSMELAIAYWRDSVRMGEVEYEVTSQIHKLQAAGIEVTHVDSHQHVHMLPGIAAAMFRAAKKCGVRAARNPFEPVSGRHVFTRVKLWKRHLQFVALRTLYASRFRRLAADHGIVTPDGCLGVLATGYLDEKLLDEILCKCPEGTWELVCHPGYADQDLRQARTKLLQSREVELNLLTRSKELLKKYGIELISYRELPLPVAR